MIETKYNVGDVLYLSLDDAVIKIRITGISILKTKEKTEVQYTCTSFTINELQVKDLL
jgi:hypothetical protein